MKLIIVLLLSAVAVQARTMTFTVTAYCPCSICCGSNSGGPTASGVRPRSGITVAGPRWMRFGTMLFIQGVGRRTVQDRLAPRYDHRIDVFMRTHAEAKRFGAKKLKVKINP